MVGRRNMLLVTKRSLRNADASGKRPKRIIQSKLMEETVGMSRQEEQELNKALYASLQENRRSKSMPSLLGHSDDSNSQVDNNISFDASGGKNSSSVNSGRHLLPSGSKSTKPRIGHRRSLRAGMASPLRHLKRTQKRIRPASASPSHKSSSKLPSSLGIDESSQDSGRSSVSSANGSKRKIHAQRKFAQGCSLPGTPSSTPAKLATPSIKKISSRMPKTEDFLTFLCFRGTSALPPHLDFFNYSREELASQEEGHKSGSSNKDKHQREGTPESSSSSCGANEEVAEAAENVNTPISAGKGSGGSSLLAKRSAARASAGTPETARGIVSLRQGLQRKVSSSSSSRSSSPRLPVAPASSLFFQCQTQQASSSSAGATLINPAHSNTLFPTRNYRPKFYFTPEKSPSPSKASGVRPGEFTPPSIHQSSLYFGSVRNFSPLVCRPTSESASPRSTPAKGLYSSSSSPYPTSSRSSWSSTASMGTPKRRKQGIIPLPSEDVGKVTSFCASTSNDFSLNTHCELIDFSCHSSSLCPSPSATITSSSSLGVRSVQNTPSSSVVSPPSACVLNPHELPFDHSDLSKSCISDIPSSNLSSNCLQPPLSSSFDTNDECLSACHASHCQCLIKTARYKAAGDEESCPACSTAISQTLKCCHKAKSNCPQCTSGLSHTNQTNFFTNHISPLTLHVCPACSTNHNSSCHNYESVNPMHEPHKPALHEQTFHYISDHALCSDSCMQTMCFQQNRSSDRKEQVSSNKSCNCLHSLGSKCMLNANDCSLKKQSPVDSWINVSVSCMDELPSLSGQTISIASQEKESSPTSNNCNVQWAIISNSKNHNNNNSSTTNKDLAADNHCKVIRTVTPAFDLVQSKPDSSLKSPVSNTHGPGDEIFPKKPKRISVSDLLDQQRAAHFEDYDFAIVHEEKRCAFLSATEKGNVTKNDKQRRKDKESKSRRKKKKHKKHGRKKIKLTETELRIPKLTIRISKKHKVCSLSEKEMDNSFIEKDYSNNKQKTNFQEEFIKMLEATSVPDITKNPDNVSKAHKKQNNDDCILNETRLSSDEEISDQLLLDYHGCISESELFLSKKCTQDNESKARTLPNQEFFSTYISENLNTSNAVKIVGVNSPRRLSTFPDFEIGHENNNGQKIRKQVSSPTINVCFDAQGEERMNLKKREEIIKAYSKFNTRHAIESNIEIIRGQNTLLDELDQNFSEAQNVSGEADPISSGNGTSTFKHDSRIKNFRNENPNFVRATCKRHSLENHRMSCKQKVNSEKWNPTEKRSEITEGFPLEKISNSNRGAENQILNFKGQSNDLSEPEQLNVNIYAQRKRKNKCAIFRNLKKRQLKSLHKIKSNKKSNLRAALQKSNECDASLFCGKGTGNKDYSLTSQNMQKNCSNQDLLHSTSLSTKTLDSLKKNFDSIENIDEQCTLSKSLSRVSLNKPCSKETCKKTTTSRLEELSSFEKGKTFLLDQILDWASIALTELAHKCSLPEKESDSCIDKCDEKDLPRPPLTSDSKSDKSKKIKRMVLDSFCDKDQFNCTKCDRCALRHVHKCRKKKMHKSDMSKQCRHFYKTRRVYPTHLNILKNNCSHFLLDEVHYSLNPRLAEEVNSHLEGSSSAKKSFVSLGSRGDCCGRNFWQKAGSLQCRKALSDTDNTICLSSPELVEKNLKKTRYLKDRVDKKCKVIKSKSNNESFENFATYKAQFENTVDCELKNKRSETFCENEKMIITGKDTNKPSTNQYQNLKERSNIDCINPPQETECREKLTIKILSESENSSLVKYQEKTPLKDRATESDVPLDLSSPAVSRVEKKENEHVFKGDLLFSNLKSSYKTLSKEESKPKQLATDLCDNIPEKNNQIKKSNTSDKIHDSSDFLLRSEFGEILSEEDQQQMIHNIKVGNELSKNLRDSKEMDIVSGKEITNELIENINVYPYDHDVLKITGRKVNKNFSSKHSEDLVAGDILLISPDDAIENEETKTSKKKIFVNDLKSDKKLSSSWTFKGCENIDKEIVSNQEKVTEGEIFDCEDDQHTSNDIAVHSFGSLNTGQGFAVVNGRLERCQILHKMQLTPYGKLKSESTSVLKCNSRNKFGAAQQEQPSVLQEISTQGEVRHSSINNSQGTQQTPCKAQNSCTNSALLTAGAANMQHTHEDCERESPTSKLDNNRLCGVEGHFSKYAILYQTRPQLQRSIYLKSRDQMRNKKSRTFTSIDNPCRPFNENVKIFQNKSTNLDSSFQFQDCPKAKSQTESDYPSSSSKSLSSVNTYQNNSYLSQQQNELISGKSTDSNPLFPQKTRSSRKKSFDHSFCSHPAKQACSSLSKDRKWPNSSTSHSPQTDFRSVPNSEETIHLSTPPLSLPSNNSSKIYVTNSVSSVNTLSSVPYSGPKAATSLSQLDGLTDDSWQPHQVTTKSLKNSSLLKTCHKAIININSNVTPVSKSNELSSPAGDPQSSLSQGTYDIAPSKSDSGFIGHNKIQIANLMPLDLSCTREPYHFQQEAAQGQHDYPLDLAFTTDHLGFDMNLTDEFTNPSGANEHVLDAIMAELKLQIEQLKEEILQGQSGPSSGHAKESMSPSSCFILPS